MSVAVELRRSDEHQAALLEWRDRWGVEIDDACLEGWRSLEDLVDAEIGRLTWRALVRRGASAERVRAGVERWSRHHLRPTVEAARRELAEQGGQGGALAGAELSVLVDEHVERVWVARVVLSCWTIGASLLILVTIATTAGLSFVPVMNVVSSILALVTGISLGSFPARFLRAALARRWRAHLQERLFGPEGLRARLLQAVESDASPAGAP